MKTDNRASARPLMKTIKALNVYQMNISQIVQFMFKFKHNMAPSLFTNHFQFISHKYPTNYSSNNFRKPKTNFRQTQFSIKFRGPDLWNNFLDKPLKEIENFKSFKASVKLKLLNSDKELNFY